MDTHHQFLDFLGIFVFYLIFCSVQHWKHQCYIWPGTHMLWNTDVSYVIIMKMPPGCRRLSQAHWSIQMGLSQMIMLFLCCEYYKLFLHLLKIVFVSWAQAWGAVEIWGLKSVLFEFYCAIVSFMQSSKYTNRCLQGNSRVLSRYEGGMNHSLQELISPPRLEESPQEEIFHYLSWAVPIPSALIRHTDYNTRHISPGRAQVSQLYTLRAGCKEKPVCTCVLGWHNFSDL